MQTRHHPLRGAPIGTRREIVSVHYGPADSGRKAYLQAALHADELPGMLVAHHLRRRLLSLEAAGRLRGEIVLVPVANPIGLAQSVLRSAQGRFELHSGENFNRHYPALLAPVLATCDRDRVPAYLEASHPANVPFYESVGFVQQRHIPLGSNGPTYITMWREPRGVKP